MRLGNALTLTSIYAEGEEELQEASSEAELHGHSLVETATPGAIGWHVFSLFADTSRLFSAMTGATSAVRTPPYHSAGKDPATEDDEDDDDPSGFRRQHDQWDEWPQDEIDMSQLGGAPLGTKEPHR